MVRNVISNNTVEQLINDFHGDKLSMDAIEFEFRSEESKKEWAELEAKYADNQMIFDYVRNWAKVMQVGKLNYNLTISQMAEETAGLIGALEKNEFDTAVDLLYRYWKYGEELAKWYDTEYQGK